MCKISVIMPVYNSEKYVSEAIDSVLNQSFEDFEFIIIDDGSTDRTCEIINSYNDSRIVLIKNNHNYIKSCNKGLRIAKGDYIARMDSDDIMHIDRLKIQYSILNNNKDIAVCSSNVFIIDSDIKKPCKRINVGKVSDVLFKLAKQNFIYHPSVMFNASFIKKNKLKYKEKYITAEDYKLWMDIAICGGGFYIEDQPLMYYRVSSNQVSVINKREQEIKANSIRLSIIRYLISTSDSYGKDLKILNNVLSKFEKDNIISLDNRIDMVYDILNKVVKNKTNSVL